VDTDLPEVGVDDVLVRVRAAVLNPYEFVLNASGSPGRVVGAVGGNSRRFFDRTYPLADAADGLRYVEHGHAHGKVVITMA
jgi:NADPH:quinone reductase-like Zn-dependent oxidoreductase